MKEKIVYIKSGGGRSVAHFMQLCSDRLLVMPDVASAVRGLGAGERCIFLYERMQPEIDQTNIRLLRSSFPDSGIVLLTSGLDPDDRRDYLRAGVNTGISPAAGIGEFRRMIRFMEDYTFKYKAVATHADSLGFRMPLWKRLFDILASLGAIVILSPLLLATALAVRLDSPGPVIYRSKRVGSNYKVFDFLKFRSMRTDADSKLRAYAGLNQYAGDKSGVEQSVIGLDDKRLDDVLPVIEQGMLVSDDYVIPEQEHLHHVEQEQEQAFVKIENDPRITRVGRFIRKYSIDELPQLFNILKGDMSVVGNRPLPLYEAENLTSDEYIDRFMCPSGLTGLWQVEKRGSAGRLSPEERKKLDIRYARTMSPWLDMKIILRTFTAFIQKENV